MRKDADQELERKNRLASKINTAKEIPVFSDSQINTFNSKYVDSFDEALAVLDETNTTPDLDQTNS